MDKFELFNGINEDAKEVEEITQLIEQIRTDLFGDVTPVSQETWDNAEDADRNITEAGGAAMARAGERDWVRDMAARGAKEKGASYSEKGLGIKEKGTPKAGERVMLPKGIGTIVDIDAKSKQVIIRSQQGQEKVFKMDALAGPKVVKNADGEATNTWSLQ